MAPYLTLREAVRTYDPKGVNEHLVASPTFTLQDVKLAPEYRRVICEELGLGKWTSSPSPRIDIPAESLYKLGLKGTSPITIRFGYATKPESLESATYKSAVGDEFGQGDVKEGSIDAIFRRLSIHRGRLFLLTTPYELGWLKTRFHDRADGANIDLIRFESIANPAFSKEEWERAQKDLPPWKFDLFYRAVFTRPAGQVYDCFDDAQNVYRGGIPDGWDRYIGIDFGLVNMAAVCLAEERDEHGNRTGRFYLYSRYKESGPDMATHAKGIVGACGKAPMYAQGGSHQESGWRQSLLLGGLHCGEPVVRSVDVQIARVYAAFKARRLLISEELRDVLDEVLEFSHELDDSGQPLDRLKDEHKYHFLAALRYIADYVFRDIEVGKVGDRITTTNGPAEAGRFPKPYRIGAR